MLSYFRKRATERRSPGRSSRRGLSLEQLEERSLLATFAVANLNDAGAGSLRQAIIDANNNVGADTIRFDVAGTIELTSGALATITGATNIDGTTAPGYASAPIVEIDFNNFQGLMFGGGASESILQGLALTGAGSSGVTISDADNVRILSNYIGLALDGITADGNNGDGLQIAQSTGSAVESNVISGNVGNGIGLYDADNNVLAKNSIGTDYTGTIDLGNRLSGILITSASAGNLIGGEATGGNDPTNGVFVRPPDGNLISGNDAYGVLINDGASENQLSGNFIGTTASGNTALGNALDGVAIENADGNILYGCTFETDPFVFYNVISGNGGNGLRVTNADNTTIQANFFGMAANNNTALGNALNGVLINGDSSQTIMGGPIPLGNVVAANLQNGIVVADTASFFTSYNTFCGLAAFSDVTTFGNALDGMLITTTGGNILIRTNVIASNGDDGIEISGHATDVRVAGNIIGLNTQGLLPMGNGDNGVEVGGFAHYNLVGGPNATFNIIPHNAISANGGYGVAFVDSANNNALNFSNIGTDLLGTQALGNAKSGVLLGPGTSLNEVGAINTSLRTIISGNASHGVELRDTHDNQVIGSFIGTDVTGAIPLGNGGSGVSIVDSSDNVIGVRQVYYSRTMYLASTDMENQQGNAGAPNRVAFNAAAGVAVESGSSNGISQNSIHSNAGRGIELGPTGNDDIAAPVITQVEELPTGVRVTGSLASWPTTTFDVEFFANEADGPSGRYFLGAEQVTTNAAGLTTFTVDLPTPPSGANFITATSTDPSDNTSEFSAAVSLLGVQSLQLPTLV